MALPREDVKLPNSDVRVPMIPPSLELELEGGGVTAEEGASEVGVALELWEAEAEAEESEELEADVASEELEADVASEDAEAEVAAADSDELELEVAAAESDELADAELLELSAEEVAMDEDESLGEGDGDGGGVGADVPRSVEVAGTRAVVPGVGVRAPSGLSRTLPRPFKPWSSVSPSPPSRERESKYARKLVKKWVLVIATSPRAK